MNLTVALERDRGLFDDIYFNVSCYQAFNSEACIQRIDAEKAHMMSLDAGQVFVAGRYNSLVPIMQEAFDNGFTNFYAVAVIKTGTVTDMTSLRDLRGKQACFSEVGSQAGWTIPIYTVSVAFFFFCNSIDINKGLSFKHSCKKKVAWKLLIATITLSRQLIILANHVRLIHWSINTIQLVIIQINCVRCALEKYREANVRHRIHMLVLKARSDVY